MLLHVNLNAGTATESLDYTILTDIATIPPTFSRRKRSDNIVEETVELIQIEADNTPNEGSETFSVQLMSASFLGFPLDVSDTELQYTIQDGRFVFLLIY